MIEPVILTKDSAPQLAAFTRVAAAFDPLSTAAIERTIFEDPDPHLELGVFDTGLEAFGSAVVRGERGFVKFLAVHPMARLERRGTDLLERLETFCREQGARSVEVGNSAPFYIVPGIDVRATEAICFFQSRGYRKIFDAVNQGVRLTGLPQPMLRCHEAKQLDVERIMPWIAEHFPDWIAETTRAFELGTLLVHEDLGFSCYDVNRDGWFGPTATKPGRGTKGVGTATLLAALHKIKERGHEHAEIAWSGPLLFYMKAVRARISRVFWVYRKEL
jgi:GNAT superfamily N-acetyltransferase